MYTYHSLAELNEEWEDYKPEGWWFIDRAYEPHMREIYFDQLDHFSWNLDNDELEVEV